MVKGAYRILNSSEQSNRIREWEKMRVKIEFIFKKSKIQIFGRTSPGEQIIILFGERKFLKKNDLR